MFIRVIEKNVLPVEIMSPAFTGSGMSGLGAEGKSLTSQVTDVLNVGVKAYTEAAAKRSEQLSAKELAAAKRQDKRRASKAQESATESKARTQRTLIVAGAAAVALLAIGAVVVRRRRRGRS